MDNITTAIKLIPLEHYVFLCFALFSIGVFGILFRRNTIVMLMCIELMLNSVNLLFTAFSAYRSDAAGQVFVFFIMVVAAVEVAVGLSILVMMKRNVNSVDVNLLNKLKN
ncbi:MAG: NADH-quinone oxidoreductase subunit NuoK [Bacteroidetes bacterium]|nr:NADH-quinone oxidoreductase subunit NuoK [Bacteroidota bacterium]